MTIRLGLDARLAGIKHAGLGRYTLELAAWLPLLLPANYQLVYFVATKPQIREITDRLAALPLARGRLVKDCLGRIEFVLAPIPHYSLAEQTVWPKLIAAANLELLHVPHFNVPLRLPRRLKLVITIHDLLWHEEKGRQVTTLSGWKYDLKYLGYRLVVRHAVRRAQAIITPSHTIKKVILHYYPQVKDKLTVIYNGVTGLGPTRRQQPGNYLLYVGSLYPHKNVELVLRALTERPDINLVIVSARNAFSAKIQTKIKELGLESQVDFRGQVSDSELIKLYQGAKALVQPSISEGFGLTGIEAMKLGTKVLASDIPTFKEIYGKAYAAFAPHSVASFLTAYDHLEQVDDSLWQKAMAAQAAKYDWQLTVRQVIKVYEQL